jgi:cGMP-dependent protein kinase
VLYKGDYFGERSLLYNERRTATIISDSKVQCIYISRHLFNSLISPNNKQLMFYRIKLQDDKTELNQLEFIEEIGVGHFGEV